MKAWTVFVLAGIGTYLTRASFIAAGSAVELPASVRRGLKYVGPAVFAAIVAPGVVGDRGMVGLVVPDARLLAAALAAYVAYRTKDITLVLVVGMLGLWSLSWMGL